MEGQKYNAGKKKKNFVPETFTSTVHQMRELNTSPFGSC